MAGGIGRFVTVLEFARVESFLPHFRSLPGRPVEDRAALARAFIAKAVFDIPTTRALIERLQVDRTLRRLCGWTYAGEIPSEATFSRAFAEFSASALPARLHEALIEKTLGDHLVGHVSRDATAIEARERPAPKPRAEKPKAQARPPAQGRGAAQGAAPRDHPLRSASIDSPTLGTPGASGHAQMKPCPTLAARGTAIRRHHGGQIHCPAHATTPTKAGGP